MSGSELFAAICQQPRAHRFVDFPRIDPKTGEPFCQVALWVLTPSERSQATAAAERYAKSLLPAPKEGEHAIGYETLFEIGATAEFLARACRHPDDVSRPFFPSAQAILDALTTEEASVLFQAYLDVQLELGPVVSTMTPSEMEAWLDKLEAGGLATSPFIRLSRGAIVDLLMYSVSRYLRLRTENSSSGQHSVEHTESSPSEQGSDE